MLVISYLVDFCVALRLIGLVGLCFLTCLLYHSSGKCPNASILLLLGGSTQCQLHPPVKGDAVGIPAGETEGAGLIVG